MLLLDTLSRSDYGAIGPLLAANQGDVETEVEGRRMVIGGTFTMGPTFAADGNVLMSRKAFLQIWPNGREDEISVGLLTLKPGSDVEAAEMCIRDRLGIGAEEITESNAREEDGGVAAFAKKGLAEGFPQ